MVDGTAGRLTSCFICLDGSGPLTLVDWIGWRRAVLILIRQNKEGQYKVTDELMNQQKMVDGL